MARPSLALSIALLLGACTARRAAGAQCAFASDCADTLVCASGACRAQCLTDRDCTAGALCVAGSVAGRSVCLGSDSPALCASNADCTGAMICSARGFCSRACGGDADCASINPGALCSSAGLCELPLSRMPTVDVVLADAVDAAPDALTGMDAPSDTAIDASSGDSCPLPDSGACAVPGMLCSGRCVDTSWDTAHCGSCGTSCAGNACTVGQCRSYQVRELAGLGYAFCARTHGADGDHALCWGVGLRGKLASGTTMDQGSPTRSPMLDGITALAGGFQAGCGLFADHTARCWGAVMGGLLSASGDAGTPGDGGRYQPQVALSPVPVPVPRELAQVAVAKGFACGVTMGSGEVYCWGEDGTNRLGDGHFADDPSRFAPPTRVTLPRAASRVAAMEDSSCALLLNAAGDTNSNLYCWGNPYPGQLGRPLTAGDHGGPFAVALPPGRIALDVSVGIDHACALLDDHTVQCWGDNSQGQLGQGTLTPGSSETPLPVTASWGSEVPQRLLVMPEGQCAVMQSGSVWCWGWGDNNMLGSSAVCERSLVPVPLDYVGSPVALAFANGEVCALRADGAVRCWYRNERGALVFEAPAWP